MTATPIEAISHDGSLRLVFHEEFDPEIHEWIYAADRQDHRYRIGYSPRYGHYWLDLDGIRDDGLSSPDLHAALETAANVAQAVEEREGLLLNPARQRAGRWIRTSQRRGKINLDGKRIPGIVFERWKRDPYVLELKVSSARHATRAVDVEVSGPYGTTGIYDQDTSLANLRPHAIAFANYYIDLPEDEQSPKNHDPFWIWEQV